METGGVGGMGGGMPAVGGFGGADMGGGMGAPAAATGGDSGPGSMRNMFARDSFTPCASGGGWGSGSGSRSASQAAPGGGGGEAAAGATGEKKKSPLEELLEQMRAAFASLKASMTPAK